MRHISAARRLLFALSLALALPAAAQQFTPPRPSPNAKVTQTIGLTEVSVTYSRPGVKGRAIWGALVPYGEPWRTGANEATQFTTSDDIMVEGHKVPAGTYAVVTIPTADRWTFALSSQKEMWGSNGYDAKNDVVRVTVKPVAAEMVERLEFTFDDPATESATLNLRWEKLSVPVKLTVDTPAKALASARAAVAAAKPDDWRTPFRAASWGFDAGVAQEDVATWAKTAAKTKDNFQTAGLLARMAAKQGDTKNAVVLMKKSIAFGKADTLVAKEQIESNEKLLTEWTANKK